MPDAIPVPPGAITAAAGAIWGEHVNGPVPVDGGQWSNQLARAALAAAAPLIAAAERRRIGEASFSPDEADRTGLFRLARADGVLAERQRIAAVLLRAAAGHREYASGLASEEAKGRLELAAACCESAAQVITDAGAILDVIPSWRWTDEERAALRGPAGDPDA